MQSRKKLRKRKLRAGVGYHLLADGWIWNWAISYRVSSKWKKNNFGSNRNKQNKICFAFVSVCFVKPKKIFFGLFRCFEPISKQPKQTELFRNEPKQSGIFWKIPKYALYQNLAVQKKFSLKEDKDKKKKSPKTLFIIQGGSDISGTLSNLPRCIKKINFFTNYFAHNCLSSL